MSTTINAVCEKCWKRLPYCRCAHSRGKRSAAAKPCLPSAVGCADARASSNHAADSSSRCADESGSGGNRETYWCVFHVKDGEFPVAAFRVESMSYGWIRECAWPENYRVERRRVPINQMPPDAAPCGQRAGRRNADLRQDADSERGT